MIIKDFFPDNFRAMYGVEAVFWVGDEAGGEEFLPHTLVPRGGCQVDRATPPRNVHPLLGPIKSAAM